MDIKFAYWILNVSGGLVVSKIAQRTDWTLNVLHLWVRSLSNSRYFYLVLITS
ncbi:MAG: hypothetical protein KME50_23320 [Nostoc desertorum CM1-VF14]|nr:hypothetical protein [Nostoc desertorum CM1-VF14]